MYISVCPGMKRFVPKDAGECVSQDAEEGVPGDARECMPGIQESVCLWMPKRARVVRNVYCERRVESEARPTL